MRFRALAVIIAALSGSAAVADVDGSPDDPALFTFGGFGTFGLTHSSRHDADFTSTRSKPNGAGFSHNWSNDVDSLISGMETEIKNKKNRQVEADLEAEDEQL